MRIGAIVCGLFLSLLATAQVRASDQLSGVYNLHLFFGDTKPFLDELTIKVDEKGKIGGQMHVPGDFDAELEGITTEGSMGVTKLSFFVSLPDKYHKAFGNRLFYELHFLSRSPFTIDYKEQFAGFVTHHKTEYRPTYVGSVVGFRKE